MADTVLITGARSTAALDLARDFRAIGFRVHLADCSGCMMARLSSAPHQVHRYAPPRQAPRQFVRDMTAIVASVRPHLVVPACEEIFHLAAPALVPILEGRLFASPLETLHRLHAKDRFLDLCRGLTLPMPEARRLTDVADLAVFAGDSARWVFKPCYSRFGGRTLVGPDPGLMATVQPSPRDPWLAQRRIDGTEVSFYATARNGALSAFSAYGAGWRLPGGASYAFDPIGGLVAKRLEAYATGLVRALDLTGQIACDAITDRDGRTWLLECNPRATSGVHLLAGTGGLARAIVGSTGVHRAGLDSRHLLPALVAFGLSEAIRHRRWRDWWRQARSARDVVGRPGDRAPVLGAVADSLIFSLAARRRGESLRMVTTRDIEWNGEELA